MTLLVVYLQIFTAFVIRFSLHLNVSYITKVMSVLHRSPFNCGIASFLLYSCLIQTPNRDNYVFK